jgi:alpha-L-rhamnosidase
MKRHAMLCGVLAALVCVMWCMAPVAFAGKVPGAWIAPYHADKISPSTPCPMLRTSFVLPHKPVAGTVRVIGLGHFALTVNGKSVGTSLINQPWSQYNKTVYWQEFDLAGLLGTGENVIGMQMGNSFWIVGPANDPGRFVKTDAMPDFSNGVPYLVWLEGRVTMDDGTVSEIRSDKNWQWSESPLTFSHIYAGEDYDARLAQPGWDAPGFNAASWKPVEVVTPPGAATDRYTGPPIRAFEVFMPTDIKNPRPGEYTWVFPQNASVLVRFTIEGEAGKTVRLKPCEYMDSTGAVKFTYTWGTKKDIWHDYTLRGNGSETHQILFCYEGAQYVGVTGAVPAGQPNPGNLPVVRSMELVHVSAANTATGSFQCSDTIQNRAYHMIDWSIRSNMSYVATDCPHREKNGWQEENWHMARAMSYAFDVRSWFTKIARDLRDTQLPDGHVPTNCPNFLVGIPPHGYWNEAPEWGISSVLVPWHVYEWYGDASVLRSNFTSMKMFVDYLSSQAADGIITSNLGDWYDYGHGKGDGPSQWTPNEVSATAIWALGAKTVAQAAAVLKLSAEEKRYDALFRQIRADFQRRFYDAVTKTIKNNGSCQAGHSAALCIGLVPVGDRPAVLRGIIADLEKRNWQQTVGEVMQIFFVRALAEMGRNDVLHRVYARQDRGSYGFMVNQGFTSLPESWDARPGTPNSMNHFMLGHLMEWQYAYVAGIRQKPGRTGWRHVVIAPNPGALEFAQASFRAPTGTFAVEWWKKNGTFEMTIVSPKGVTTEAILPNGVRYDVVPGRVTYRINMN